MKMIPTKKLSNLFKLYTIKELFILFFHKSVLCFCVKHLTMKYERFLCWKMEMEKYEKT